MIADALQFFPVVCHRTTEHWWFEENFAIYYRPYRHIKTIKTYTDDKDIENNRAI